MADDKEITFKLSAETKEFVEKILSAKGTLQSLGNADNLSGLTDGLLKVGAGLGIIGAAAFALKASFEAIFDAEQIKQINIQFQNLADNAGLSTDALRKGLTEAARGLVDDTDLLKAANKAIVEMGDRASKLPEIMELARKATNVFGGETIDNFEAINRAIATGSTRQLRNLGLQIDAEKAYKEYAKSIGTVASALSEAGKQEAIMTAVLEKGQSRFRGVDGDILKTTNTWTQLKVTIKEVGETIALTFEKLAGPAVRAGLSALATYAHKFSEFIKGKDKQEEIAHTASQQRAKEDRIDHEKELDARMKVEKAIIELKQSGLQAAKSVATSEADVTRNLTTEIEIILREAELKKYNVRKSYRDGYISDQKEMNAILQGIEQDRINKELAAIKKLKEEREKAEDNYIAASRDEGEATARAAEVSSARAIRSTKDYAEQGKKNFDSLKTHSINAFQEMGAGQKSAAEAAKGFLFNVIADRAQAEGEVLLLSSLWPPNPLGLAAGGGLIALAGFLRSQAGGGSSSTAAADVSGGAGSIGGFGTRTDQKPTLEQQTQKSLNITIQGHYFETEQTKTALVDLIRQNQDATDYKVTSVGGGI